MQDIFILWKRLVVLLLSRQKVERGTKGVQDYYFFWIWSELMTRWQDMREKLRIFKKLIPL